MPKNYYQPGQHLCGMTILCIVDRGKCLQGARYAVRCDCGHQNEMVHTSIALKIKQQRNKCLLCAVPERKPAKQNKGDPEINKAVSVMQYINRFWKPPMNTQRYIWGQQG